MINLTKYALKQTHNGQITIKTCFNYVEKMLEVHIVNTGKGISQNKKQKLLKALALKTHSSNSAASGHDNYYDSYLDEQDNDSDGEGIEIEYGLLICKKILKCSGGLLDLHSDGEGRGSTFAFKIRMDLPDSPNSAITNSTTIVEEIKTSSKKHSNHN